MSVEAETHAQTQPTETEAVATSKVGERIRGGGDFIKNAADRLADKLDARAQKKANRQYVEGGIGDLQDMADGKEVSAESGSERESRTDKARKLFRSIGNNATRALRATGELAVGAGVVAGRAVKSGAEQSASFVADKAGDARNSVEAKAGEVRSALTDRMDQAIARKQARLEARAEKFAKRNAERLEHRQAVQDQREAFASYSDNIDFTAEREANDAVVERQEKARLDKEERESRAAQEKAEREARAAERAAEAKARKEARQQKWAARKQVFGLAVAKSKEVVVDKVAEARQAVAEGASQVADAGRRGYESATDAVKTGADATTEAFKTNVDRVKRGGEWLKTRVDNVRAIGSAAISAAVEAGRSTSAAIKVNEQLGQ